jgi:hypothetical protein
MSKILTEVRKADKGYGRIKTSELSNSRSEIKRWLAQRLNAAVKPGVGTTLESNGSSFREPNK